MKFTSYFLANHQRPDRRLIELEWIARVVREPTHRRVQADGRLRLWARIEEAEDRWLRVVILEDGETIHNAFFDRRFKEDDDAG